MYRVANVLPATTKSLLADKQKKKQYTKMTQIRQSKLFLNETSSKVVETKQGVKVLS